MITQCRVQFVVATHVNYTACKYMFDFPDRHSAVAAKYTDKSASLSWNLKHKQTPEAGINGWTAGQCTRIRSNGEKTCIDQFDQ